jgi:hypothetical protein
MPHDQVGVGSLSYTEAAAWQSTLRSQAYVTAAREALRAHQPTPAIAYNAKSAGPL